MFYYSEEMKRYAMKGSVDVIVDTEQVITGT